MRQTIRDFSSLDWTMNASSVTEAKIPKGNLSAILNAFLLPFRVYLFDHACNKHDLNFYIMVCCDDKHVLVVVRTTRDSPIRSSFYP